MLKIYNTLSKQLEPIELSPQTLTMYTCGPTVYAEPHIGNMRSNINADLLYRTLKAQGQNVKWVMNLTDIDDKTIAGTIKQYGSTATVENLKAYTAQFTELFFSDLKKVNVSWEEIEFINVTDVVPQIQEFIAGLIDKGFAYKAEDGSTYFSIENYQAQFKDYGQLVGEKFLEGKQLGARVKSDEYDKNNLSDFALWKAWDQNDAQIYWDHPTLGKGRPGWHIECSVINHIAFGGRTTDIHTGGVDLIFPHHTNEIAQSQPFYKPFANYWMHSEFLLVDNTKMSKSLNNFYTISDIEAKGYSGLDLRYLFLQTNFRKQTNFTWEALAAAKVAREKLQRAAQNSQPTDNNPTEAKSEFFQALNDNLNTAQALAVAWEDKTNLKNYDQVLGLSLDQSVPDVQLDIPAAVEELVQQRQSARDNKDFALADQIRQQIEQYGYQVKDTADGQKLEQK